MTHKHPNVGLDLERAIQKVHRAGIDLVGSFVFGLDGDTTSIFRETVTFTERVKMAVAQFAVLTPFPGTPVYEELKAEGRITNYDWSQYTMGYVVYEPKGMTAAELTAGRKYAYGRFFGLPSIAKRGLVLRGNRVNYGLRAAVNLSYRNRLRGGTIADSLPCDGVVKAPVRPTAVARHEA